MVVPLFPMTDVGTGLAHWVTGEAMTSGQRTGRYTTVCGLTVIPASLTALESGRCRRCDVVKAGQR